MHIKIKRSRRHADQLAVSHQPDVLLLGTMQRLTLGRPGNQVKDGKYYFR